MNSLKKVLLVLISFVFTGCTVNYNITFKNDNTVDEKISISESNTLLESSEYDIKEIIDSKISSYSDEINENNFSFKSSIGSKNTKVVLSSKDKPISKFVEFPYFTKMFNGADIVEDGNKYSFKTNGIYNQSGLFYDLSGVADEGFVDKININITFEDKVVSANADSFDEKTNTYTWSIDKNTSQKSIEFELLKNNKVKQKNKNSYDYKSILIFTGIVVGLTLIILLYVLALNKKRNKL